MKNVIITLTGLMVLGTSALVADGSTIDDAGSESIDKTVEGDRLPNYAE